MDKFSELKAAAMAATPGRIGDRIDGSGSIKYECTGYDGSLVLRTNHKDMEYGFVGDNADADELFFRLCVPDVVLALLAELEAKDERIDELEEQKEGWVDIAKAVGLKHDELKAKLATPVRLPTALFCPEEYVGSLLWSETEAYNKAISKSAEGIRAAGFKVEEDE